MQQPEFHQSVPMDGGVSFGQPGSQQHGGPPMQQGGGQPNYPNMQQQGGMQQGGMQQGGQPAYPPMGGAMGGLTNPNGAVAQLGMHYLGSAGDQARGAVSKYVSVSVLKTYFDVTNSYVSNKVKIILCPLLHQNWARSSDGNGKFLSPRHDINAPDLYVPLMAFVTYILLIAFVLGTGGSFHPEVLGKTASSGIAVLVLEVMIIKGGFYFLSSPTPVPFTDLLAYCAYKYVGVIVNVIVGLLFGWYAYYLALFVNSAFAAIFVVKTLKRVIVPDTIQSLQHDRRRDYFLIVIGLMQLPTALFLGYTDLFSSAPGVVLASNAAAVGAAVADASAAAADAAGSIGSAVADAAVASGSA